MSGRLAVSALALALVFGATPEASAPAVSPAPDGVVQRHHYSIKARIRPLLLFWITRNDIGDAVVTRQDGPDEAAYSLLIGSDPDRAPRRINRWGYIDEEIRGDHASLIGLMTESDEESIEEAEANINKRLGDRTFKIIRATVNGNQARSVVTSIAAPADYSFRQVRRVLDLAEQESSGGRTRVVNLPSGTRPGFLTALAGLLHRQVDQWRLSGGVRSCGPVAYVYHGRIYQLSVTHTRPLASVRVGDTAYPHVIESTFRIRNTYDGELTEFTMTYGAEGRLAGTPITAAFQPRWWLQIELALNDTTPGPPVASGLQP